MASKKMVVIYNGDDWHKDIPFESAPTRKSFEDWHERGLRDGIEMFRSSIDWYDEKGNVFSKAWAYRDKKWIKIVTPVRPDFVFDKLAGKYDYDLFDLKMRLTRRAKVFNHPLFRTMTDNKLAQFLFLGEFMPKSFLATNEKEFLSSLEKVTSSKAVVKPLYGSGGFGIIIEEKDRIDLKKVTFPVLIQEFVKSNKGIPGFSKKDEVADLRMIFINHEYIYSLSRIARTGSLFTNFHQGATAIMVPKERIPLTAREMAEKITAKLSVYPEANYSLDFIFTDSGSPLLMEMNTTPGFDLLDIVGDEETKERHFKKFISVMDNGELS